MDSTEKPVKYKFPKTLGACLAKLATLQDQADRLQAQLTPIANEEAALREHMIAEFKKDELQGMRGSGRSLAVMRTVVPQLEDWSKFLKFALKKGNDDLLPRSVKSDAWRERMEAGVAVPGVSSFTRVSLRVTRIKGE